MGNVAQRQNHEQLKKQKLTRIKNICPQAKK